MTSGWQPIETAPRDGTRILLADNRGGLGTVIMIIRADDLLYNPIYLDNPTHWMPLPPPPTESET